jgi:hypothetical protein
VKAILDLIERAHRDDFFHAILAWQKAGFPRMAPQDFRAFQETISGGTARPLRGRGAYKASLPWPRRSAEGEVAVGIDLKNPEVYGEVLQTLSRMRTPFGMSREDFQGEVLARLVRSNQLPSAWDPRKVSFEGYIIVTARSVRRGLIAKLNSDAMVAADSF